MSFFLPPIAFQFDILGSALGFLTAIAASFAIITLVASYYRFQHIVKVAVEKEPEEMGATPHDVLRVQLARYLAGCARRNTSFSISMIKVCNSDAKVCMDSPMVSAIKQAVRRDDITCVYDTQTAVLLTELEPEDNKSIIDRVNQAIVGACPGVSLDQLRAGIASYPGHGLSGKELIRIALDALEQTTVDAPIVMPEIVDVDTEEGGNTSEIDGTSESLSDSKTDVEQESEENRRGWKERRHNAILDELTGVLKPSAISAYMQRLMSDLRYKKQKVALFCIGVNNMAHIRRFHGDKVADDVLAGVSRILQENFRSDDLIGRHEKDAFLVLAQCSLQEAAIIGKRVSGLVQQSTFSSNGKKLKTTITLGVAVYPEHGRNLHHLYTAGQKVLDYSRANDIRAYAVYDPEIHDRVPAKPMRNIKSVQA